MKMMGDGDPGPLRRDMEVRIRKSAAAKGNEHPTPCSGAERAAAKHAGPTGRLSGVNNAGKIDAPAIP